MDDLGSRTLNPWVSMWTRPRATIQQIVDTNPERAVVLLSAVAGIGQALDRASAKNMGDKLDWPMILLFAALLGPVAGILGLYVGGALLRWTGSWMGGQGSSRYIRAAVAWSNVPEIWAMLLWVPGLALFGQELFTSKTPLIDADPARLAAFLGFAAVELVLTVWALVVFLKSLGQVQGFSAWKALGNALLAALVVIVPLAAIGIAAALVIPALVR